MYNLAGLVLFFLIYDLQFLGGFFFPSIFYVIIGQVCMIFLLIFIKFTFYKNTRSLFPYLMVLFFISKIAGSTISFFYDFRVPLVTAILDEEILLYQFYKIVIILEVSPAFLWLTFAAFRTYNNLKNYEIGPWVKKRYLIITYSSLIFALSNISTIMFPSVPGYENVNIVHSIFIASSFLVFSFGNLIAWVMPTKLKKYFNRNFSSTFDDDISEEEIMRKASEELKEGKN